MKIMLELTSCEEKCHCLIVEYLHLHEFLGFHTKNVNFSLVFYTKDDGQM